MGAWMRDGANALLMLAALGVIFVFAGLLAVDTAGAIVGLILINPPLALGLIIGVLLARAWQKRVSRWG